jgi:UDP-N-acetylglucosamine 4-epimerase
MTFEKKYYPLLQRKAEEELSYIRGNWLVTGAAGFIGSRLVETLLQNGQNVIGLDDLSCGRLERIEKNPRLKKYIKNFSFIKESILDKKTCINVSNNIDYILHHAAKISVQESRMLPAEVNDVNATGFINILEASKINNVKKLVYASSSAIYGDVKCGEDGICEEQGYDLLLSPYAISKKINEMYANYYEREYKLSTVGLRYFNVYGRGQNPDGEYAAVISKWVALAKQNKVIEIYGDGNQTRDFCFVDDVVSANILAALQEKTEHNVFNIGSGKSVTLNWLSNVIRQKIGPIEVVHSASRQGDIRISAGNIQRAKRELKYEPQFNVEDVIGIL